MEYQHVAKAESVWRHHADADALGPMLRHIHQPTPSSILWYTTQYVRNLYGILVEWNTHRWPRPRLYGHIM
jgi:hypothetical protein